MDNYKYMNEGMAANPPWMNASQLQTENQQDMMPNMRGNMAYQLVYPEIFYRLQPYIMMVCDQMDIHGNFVPTQDMVEQLTDSIHDDICRMYPDIADYADNYNQMNYNDPPLMDDYGRVMFDRDRDFDYGMFGRRFRRSGSLRDLTSILLLSEIFRRRKMY